MVYSPRNAGFPGRNAGFPAFLTAERKGSHPSSRQPLRKPAADNSPSLVSCPRGLKR